MSDVTAETDLLPMPSVLLNWPHPTNHAAIRTYARACVSSATEALRAEVAEWKRVAAAQAELHGEAEARAERLVEALREMRDYVTAALQSQREAFAGHEDCSDIVGIEADLHKIDALLREQEAGRG